MNKAVLAIAIVSTFASPAFAEKSGYYLGLGAGKASYDDAYDKYQDLTEGRFNNPTVNSFNINSTDKDDLFKLFGGYRFNQYIAVEIDYTKFSDTSSDLHATSAFNSAEFVDGKINNKLQGIGLKTVGFYPITNSFELKASVGLMRWDLEEKSNGEQANIPGVRGLAGGYSSTEKGTSLTVGLGANYNINDHFTVGLNWERINDVGNSKLAFGETDIDTYTASLQYNF